MSVALSITQKKVDRRQHMTLTSHDKENKKNLVCHVLLWTTYSVGM